MRTDRERLEGRGLHQGAAKPRERVLTSGRAPPLCSPCLKGTCFLWLKNRELERQPVTPASLLLTHSPRCWESLAEGGWASRLAGTPVTPRLLHPAGTSRRCPLLSQVWDPGRLPG